MSDGRNFSGKSSFTDSPANTPPLCITSISQTNHGYGEFSNWSQPEDFGRESLGIFDFGRESLSLLPEGAGRESLGIINLDNLDTGRESLGIINIKTYDFVLSKGSLPVISDEDGTTSDEFQIPEFKITEFGLPDDRQMEHLKQNSLSILNHAFLNLPFPSVSSTISSLCQTFNSSSLNSLPSQISSQSTNTHVDMFNDAFGDTTDFNERMQLYVRSTKSTNSPVQKRRNFVNNPSRIQSLPSKLETNLCNCEESSFLNFDDRNGSFGNFDEVFEEKCTDNECHDLLFIEGKHVAKTLTDGSFMLEDYMLDLTKEPAEMENVLNDEESVDKLLLSTHDHNENLVKSANTSRNGNDSISKSKDPIEIIGALSDICNSIQNEERKNEGQNLLASLVDVVEEFRHSSASTRSRSFVLYDSEHSVNTAAMTPGGSEVFEISYSKTKCTSESSINHIGEENCSPLDLSLKSKSICGKACPSPKILPPKFHITRPRSLTNLQGNKTVTSNDPASSNSLRSSSDLATMFKTKKSDGQIGARRGPMKAVLPVNNMAKKKNENLKLTPRSAETSTAKPEKTSTPIHTSHFKPIGQSTPDNLKNSFVTSPLARPSSTTHSGSRISKLNNLGKGMSLKKTPNGDSKTISSVMRRSSVEVVKTQFHNKTLSRSRSLEGKSKTPNRQSPQTNSFSRSKTEYKMNVLKENIKGVRRLPVVKKPGKENY